MESYKNLKKGTKVGLAVSTTLLTVTILNNAIAVFTTINNPDRIFTTVLAFNAIVISLAIMWYAFVGYKKPHGNMLRAVFFAFSVYLVIQSGIGIMSNESAWTTYLLMFAAITVSYISGRLNKIEKNRKLLVFTGILLVIFAFVNIFDGRVNIFDVRANSLGRMCGFLAYAILLAALSFAYIARYEEHKAAGLEDAN